MKLKINVLLITAATLVILPGCSSVKHTLGLDHYQADEFSVPSNPPLSMPPDYELQPPKPGAKGPGEVTHEHKAQEKLLGAKLEPVAALSNDGEKAIAAKAGEKIRVEENIREKVNQEAGSHASGVDDSKDFLDRVKDNLSGKTNEAPTTATASTKPINQ